MHFSIFKLCFPIKDTSIIFCNFEQLNFNHNITFIEASAKDNTNVDEIFVKLIDIMVNINPKKPKSKMGNLNNSNDEDNIQPKKKKCC